MPDEEKTKKPTAIEKTENQVKINKTLEKLRTIQNNRTALEKQWQVNAAYLYGHQHFSVERRANNLSDRILFALNRLQDSRKLRRVSNRILVSFRSLLSRMISRKARIVVDPETRIKRDVDSSKISEEVLEDFWKRVNKNNPYLVQKIPGMLMVQKYLYMWILTFGKAWLHPYFNEKTKSKTLIKEDENSQGTIVEAEIGEVEVKVKSPINMFVDAMGEFMIDREYISVSQIKDRYDVEVEPEAPERSDLEEQILRLIDRTDLKDVKNGANLYTRWELPSTNHSKGRMIVHTQTKFISEGRLPEEYKGRLPYIEYNWFDLLMSVNSQSLVEQLIPLQKDYNFTISRLAEYKKYLSGKLLVKDGANLQTKWTEETGQIIKYKGQKEPQYSIPPNPPSFLFEDLKRIDLNIQDLAMAHDATQGKVPSGVKSGVALRELQEQDETNLSPTIIEIEEKHSYFADMVLDIVATRYTQERILSTVGRENENEVRTFMGFETQGNRRITISLGSALPGTRQARQEFIAGLLQAQIITQQEAKRLLQLGDVEGALDDVDERNQKAEIADMLNGIPVDTNKWDIHSKHIEIVRNFMEEPRFKELPDEVRAIFISHYEKHLEEHAQEVNPSGNPPGQGDQVSGQPVEAGAAQI